ncbi:RDD family protein, partial [Cellulosimicrobium cellulans]|uniref:RDD family protein n=1 Tax=Cellulosimicrobium cellulans TaxID=1710 RepID=UPI0008486980
GVQAAAGASRADAAQPPYAVPRTSAPDTTTEPEVYTATQKAFVAPPAPGGRGLAAAPYAGVGRRVLAYVVDAAVPGILALAVILVGTALTGVPLLGGVREVTAEEASTLLGRLAVVYVAAAVVALAWWVWTWVWEGSTGKTLGNLATGIRTLDASTRTPVGFGRAFVRWLVVGAGAVVLWVGQWLVVLSPAFDSSGRRQGWQDKAARAVVVDARGVPDAGRPRDGITPRAATPSPEVVAPGGPSAPGPWSAPSAPPAPRQDPVPSGPAPSGQAPTGPVPNGAAPAPDLPDPWAFPSSAAPPAGGLITGVPGMSAPTAPAQPAPSVPAQPAPSVAQPAQPTPAPEEPDWDSTRMSARDLGAMEPAPVVTAVLELESGERRLIDGPALVGRNPQAAEGGDWILVAVEDPTRSVSKTHAELGVDPGGLWVTDRGSTNGTVVSVPGTPPRVVEPGARVRVPVGATIHVGDRRLLVHPGSV